MVMRQPRECAIKVIGVVVPVYSTMFVRSSAKLLIVIWEAMLVGDKP